MSVTDVRRHTMADYSMARGPDDLLIELFQPHAVPPELRDYFTMEEA